MRDGTERDGKGDWMDEEDGKSKRELLASSVGLLGATLAISAGVSSEAQVLKGSAPGERGAPLHAEFSFREVSLETLEAQARGGGPEAAILRAILEQLRRAGDTEATVSFALDGTRPG